jgi:peroxiredoxin
MFGNFRYRWVFVLASFLLAAGGGLIFGKWKEKDSITKLYARTDFTLLTDEGEFFQLAKLPKEKLLLLVFTPDEIFPSTVKNFQKFSLEIPRLEKLGIEVKMISRTNREIARNFKQAAKFSRPLLVDISGSVGRNLGIWPDANPVSSWGYGLINSQMQLFWAATDTQPMTVAEIIEELQKVSQKFQNP